MPTCVCLRDVVCLFSGVNLTDAQIIKLKAHCRNFYRGYCLYFYVNPTVWSLGNVVPQHTREMKAKYGLGLGVNSMEGRPSILQYPNIVLTHLTCIGGNRCLDTSTSL